jgi:triosephosphate isomerase (TIM)
MTPRKPLIAGNWKMHGRRADLAEIAATMRLAGAAREGIEVAFCPPAAYVAAAAALGLAPVGGQDCSGQQGDGARTGEISAAMLADCGAAYVIVGHSERRAQHGEGDELVCAKAKAAFAAGLSPIICVGESWREREAGRAADVTAAQIAASVPESAPANLVLAYEPVWAVGSDRTPTAAEIADMHRLAREALAARIGVSAAAGARILYGGSVSARNAAEIFSITGVDGALVGRASLKAADFAAIILAHPAASAH